MSNLSEVRCEFSNEEMIINNPISVIISSVKSHISSLKNFKSNIKKLIPVFIFGVIWLVIGIMDASGINVPDFLKMITFSDAGIGNNILGVIGGILGKTLFLTVIMNIISKIKQKKLELTEAKNKVTSLLKLSKENVLLYALGFGIAFLLYVLFTGGRVDNSLFGGLSFAILAFTSTYKNSFFRKFVSSIVHKFSKNESMEKTKNILKGSTVGFTLCALISLFATKTFMIIFGIIILIASVTMLVLRANGIDPLMSKGGKTNE